MVSQPGLPGPIVEQLAADVIEVRVVDADYRPDIGQEALTGVNTAMGRHTRKGTDIFL